LTGQKWTERRPADGNGDVSTWDRVTTPKAAEIAERERLRRQTGVVLGAILGLAYGLASQLINPVTLPGIPLYQPPAGAFGNALLSALLGAGLGFITCYPPSAALGIFFGGLASLAGILVYMLVRLGGLGFGGALVSGLIFSIPMAWLTIPVLALLRWATERQVSARLSGDPLLRRAALPAVLVVVMVALGAFELLPGEARGNLISTQALIQQGLQAGSAAALPEPLRGPSVTHFPPAQPSGYTLEWTKYDLDRFMELRPPSNFDQHAAVIARFPGTYYLVCLYPTPKQAPNCANYDKMPEKAPQRRDDG
jgi:hypothetical protein